MPLPAAPGGRRATSALGPALCAACERAAPRCATCGEPIIGVSYVFEEIVSAPTARRFCARCVQHRSRCDLCHAPVPAGGSPLVDGQLRCALCAADMVLNDTEARAVYDEALAAARRVLGVALGPPPRLELVSRRRMGDVRRRSESGRSTTPADLPGYHVLGFFVRDGRGATIYAELGLPRPLLLGTLAHELGHAWQAQHAPHMRDPLLSEGFAEWVAHRVLRARGQATMAERAATRDDLYGRGLRLYLDTERARGRTGVLALATPPPSPLP